LYFVALPTVILLPAFSFIHPLGLAGHSDEDSGGEQEKMSSPIFEGRGTMLLKNMRVNTVWIGANIIFELETGKASNVLVLVYRAEDATVWRTSEEANRYLSFVAPRAQHMQWFVDPPTPQRPQGYVIRGVQTVE
jgi:hypothetical protein